MDRSETPTHGEIGGYSLGQVVVDPSRNRIIHPDQEVAVKPGEMNLLVRLLEAAPEVVDSNQLLELVSKGRVVEESLLHRRVSQLRRALRDSPKDPRIIETFPKRGYRIIADVCRIESPVRQLALDKPPGIFPFVGRRDVLDRLGWHLEETKQLHRGRVVLLAGPPGIGKTRTAEQFLMQARLEGCQVFSGWCDESGISVPYWPWIIILRGIFDKHGH